MSLQTSSILPHRVALAHARTGQSVSTKGRKSRTHSSVSIPPAIQVLQGRTGDHLAIHALLLSLMHSPSEAEFQLNLDRPDYDPSQRLLLMHGDDLIGHIRLTPRLLRLHQTWFPTCDLSEFALLPEYATEGHRAYVLAAAKQRALDLGAALLTSRMHGASASGDSGWVANGDVCCLEGSPHDLLANCAVQVETYPEREHLRVRPWRYVEQQALMEIYDENTRQCQGTPLREDEYWHWLLVRRGYDEILVVVSSDAEGSEPESMNQQDILGYAFVRGSHIVELMVKPERPEAAIRLVQRVAADAIERDVHRIRLFQPPVKNPTVAVLSDLFGLQTNTTDASRSVQAVFVVDPRSLLDLICLHAPDQLTKQLADTKLGLKLGDQSVMIQGKGRRGLRVSPMKACQSQIATSQTQVTSLLFGGGLDENPLPDGIRCTTSSIREIAQQVFQRVTLWRSTLDDLPSSS